MALLLLMDEPEKMRERLCCHPSPKNNKPGFEISQGTTFLLQLPRPVWDRDNVGADQVAASFCPHNLSEETPMLMGK